MYARTEDNSLPRPPERNLAPHFLVMMFLYLALVYAWSLYLYPLGRDYAAMAHPEALPWGLRSLFSAELRLFGRFLPGYHFVNLTVLYGCMITLFFLTRSAVRGPWWLGSLVAVLFMANPVKAEAVLNLCGVVDLLPALFSFLVLAAYAAHVRHPRRVTFLLALGCFAIAVLPYPINMPLVIILSLYETIAAERYERILARLLPFIPVALLAFWIHGRTYSGADWSCTTAWAPLYFIAYPMGFLPETAARFQEHPALGWISAAVVFFILALLARKARQRTLVFGILGVFASRLTPIDRPVDPVHLVGGGQLLMATALLSIAFAALCHRMIQHPKWHRPVVFLTSALCVILFVAQIRGILVWREAGLHVRVFQAQAEQDTARYPGEALGVLPDIQYYRGAPMMLSSAVAYHTPFSNAVPVLSLLPINLLSGPPPVVRIEEWTPDQGCVTIAGSRPLDVFVYPYALAAPGAIQQFDEVVLERMHSSPDGLKIIIHPLNTRLPGRWISSLGLDPEMP